MQGDHCISSQYVLVRARRELIKVYKHKGKEENGNHYPDLIGVLFICLSNYHTALRNMSIFRYQFKKERMDILAHAKDSIKLNSSNL